jgi:hypothetical protein
MFLGFCYIASDKQARRLWALLLLLPERGGSHEERVSKSFTGSRLGFRVWDQGVG